MTNIYFSQFWRPEGQNQGPADYLVRAHFPLCGCLSPASVFRRFREAGPGSSSPYMRAWIHHEGSPHRTSPKPSHLPKVPPPNTITWGIRHQNRNFEGDTYRHIQSIMSYVFSSNSWALFSKRPSWNPQKKGKERDQSSGAWTPHLWRLGQLSLTTAAVIHQHEAVTSHHPSPHYLQTQQSIALEGVPSSAPRTLPKQKLYQNGHEWIQFLPCITENTEF